MSKNKIVELLCPISFLLFGIYIRVTTISMSKRDAMFPNMVAYVIIAVSIIELLADLRKKEYKDRFKGVNFLKLLECVIAMMLYVVLLKKIGFIIDTFLLSAFTMYALDYKNYKVLAIASVAITVVIFVVFKLLLKVPLPTIWL